LHFITQAVFTSVISMPVFPGRLAMSVKQVAGGSSLSRLVKVDTALSHLSAQTLYKELP
jgi:hypothetical protein